MRSLRCFLLCVSLGVSGVVFVPSAQADEGSDWVALVAARQGIGDDTFQNDPRRAVEQLDEFAKSRALHPVLQAEVTLQIAEILRMQLKQPLEALQRLDAGLEQARANPNPNPAESVEVMYLEGRAATLLAQGKSADAQQLVRDKFALIEAGAKSGHPHLEIFASRALQRLSDAQNALRPEGAKPDDTIDLLQSALRQMPVFLNPERQKSADWREGWMYERLVAALSQAGRDEEALSWGKLFFAQAAFDQAAIQGATKALSGVWSRKSDIAKVRAFAAVQATGSEATNPLADVALPTFGTESAAAVQLKKLKELQRQGAGRGRVAPIITLQIALGQWRAAMENAQALIVEDPSSSDGPQQVARVFKAKDGSVARANDFLSYLADKAPNPVPAFLEEADAQAQAAASNGDDTQSGANTSE